VLQESVAGTCQSTQRCFETRVRVGKIEVRTEYSIR
jgi:hypothetical protein